MPFEKRRSKRQSLSYDSFAVSLDGKLKRDCRIADISASGARIQIEHPEALPEHFVLVLSERGKNMRLCRVVRRNEKQVAVLFRASSRKD